MILESRCGRGTEESPDPLLSVHVRHMLRRTERVRELGVNEAEAVKELVAHAAQLCELSRDLIYRLNRVTVSQVEEIIETFQDAVTALEEANIKDQETVTLIAAYVAHIRRRVGLLREELKAVKI